MIRRAQGDVGRVEGRATLSPTRLGYTHSAALSRRPSPALAELSSYLLALGVDDFAHLVGQSAEMRERLQAALLRTQDSDRRVREGERLEVGGLRLDTRRHEAWLAGRRLILTPVEFALLRYLMCRAGEVVRRPETLDAVWGVDFNPGSNVIDRHIRTLRMKLGDARLIETIPHIGYRLRCEQEPSSLGNPAVTQR